MLLEPRLNGFPTTETALEENYLREAMRTGHYLSVHFRLSCHEPLVIR